MADREIQFLPDDFNPVQENKQISDTKLATKPTTFLKDAFRRFCKNKSSVVAAIILAILVLFGFAAMVFVAFLLIDKQETEEINNKTSE